MGSRKLTVLYGSQTGTAQEVAERIWRESKRYYFSGSVQSMDQFLPQNLPTERHVIFVCSTTGQGDEPDNMQLFWKFLLRKSLPTNSLCNTNIAVLGLGDSSYTKFNFAAKKLFKRLLQLGAKLIVELGLADDQHDLGTDAVVNPWICNLWEKMLQLCPLIGPFKPLEKDALHPPKYKISIISHTEDSSCSDILPTQNWSGNSWTPSLATLVSNTRVTSVDHFQDVRLLKMHSPNIKYKPGDVLMVQPQNLEENVCLFLRIFGLKETDEIKVQEAQDDYFIPLPPSWLMQVPINTAGHCARAILDLQAVPQRYALELLAHFTTSDLEKERLLEFCSPQGQQDLFDYCHRPRRGILEVLQDFPHASAALPIEYLFDVFRIIHPRAFSIASAVELIPDEVELLVAVVRYKTRLFTPRLGLCSNWLASLKPGSKIPTWVQAGSFKFPASPDIPVIMIGPGTGCAPFRSFVQQRVSLFPNVKGKMVLFFGCRKQHGDFHCESEWQSFVVRGFLTLFCAFSQDQENKIYVQHKIAEHCDLVWDLLHTQKAYLFVAGNAKNMPNSVREAIVNVINQAAQLPGEEYVQSLEKSGRYQQETWS